MKPDYYEDFTCIADRCSFTCCREWKIGVDEDTFVKWKHTLTPDGMYDTDRGQQAKKEKLSGYVRKKDGSRVIGLNKEKNCQKDMKFYDIIKTIKIKLLVITI